MVARLHQPGNVCGHAAEIHGCGHCFRVAHKYAAESPTTVELAVTYFATFIDGVKKTEIDPINCIFFMNGICISRSIAVISRPTSRLKLKERVSYRFPSYSNGFLIARYTNTPVSFYLEMTAAELNLWIQECNRQIEEENRRIKAQQRQNCPLTCRFPLLAGLYLSLRPATHFPIHQAAAADSECLR